MHSSNPHLQDEVGTPSEDVCLEQLQFCQMGKSCVRSRKGGITWDSANSDEPEKFEGLNRWVRITTIIYRSAATWNAVSPNHNWRKGYWKGALREESQCKINLQNQIKEFEGGSVRLVLEIDATLKKVPTELEEIECLTGRQTFSQNQVSTGIGTIMQIN